MIDYISQVIVQIPWWAWTAIVIAVACCIYDGPKTKDSEK